MSESLAAQGFREICAVVSRYMLLGVFNVAALRSGFTQ